MGKWSSEIFPAGRIALDLLPDQATSASLPLDPGLGAFLSTPGHCKRRRAALPFLCLRGNSAGPTKAELRDQSGVRIGGFVLGWGTLGQIRLIPGLTDSVRTATEADPFEEFVFWQTWVLGALEGWMSSGLDLGNFLYRCELSVRTRFHSRG